MSYILLPYGLVRNEKKIQFNLPKNDEESQYTKRLPYIRDKRPQFDNSIINVIQIALIWKNGFWLQVTMVENCNKTWTHLSWKI